jgi:hypothetical protein
MWWWTRTEKQPAKAKHRAPTSTETAYVVRRNMSTGDTEHTFHIVAGTDPYTTVRPAAMVAKKARYCQLCVPR